MFLNLKEGFGQKLKELRKSKGYTQEKLAEKLDITPRQLTRIETGDNFPSVETLSKICYVMNIDPKSLFDFEWDVEYSYFTTGTDDKPVMTVSERDGVIDFIPHLKNSQRKKFPSSLSVVKTEDGDDAMLEMAKNIGKPFTVKYNDDNGELSCIKTYYPDGNIEVLMSKEKVELKKILQSIIEDLKGISEDKNKLEFIRYAIKAFDSKENLTNFKLILKGIEMMQNS